MLHFGPAGIPAGAVSSEEGIKLVSSLGLTALEFEFVRGVRIRLDEAKRLGKLASDSGLRLSAHAPYYINLNSKNPGTTEKSKEHVLQTMKAAGALGARIIVVHAGFYSGMAPDAATAVMIDMLAACREKADDEGCSDVLIGLETMGRAASWGTLDEIKKVSLSVKRVFPVIDFAHLHARCGGCLRTAGDFSAVLEKFEGFGAPFLHVHFTGIEFGPRGEKRHLELSSRSPDFGLLAPSLKDKRYDITVICESPMPVEDALVMKNTCLM